MTELSVLRESIEIFSEKSAVQKENKLVIKDSYFKTFFQNKYVAIVLLTKVIPELKEYDGISPEEILNEVELTYLPTELVVADLKVIRLDIFLKISGEHISIFVDLEMQTKKPTDYKIESRALYYACRMISDQLRKNEIDNTLEYCKLEKIYCIWLLSYPSELFKDYITYIRNFQLKDFNNEVFGEFDKFNLVMIDVTNRFEENEIVKYLEALNDLLKGNSAPIERYIPYDIMKDEVTSMKTFEEMRTEELLEEGRELGIEQGEEIGKIKTILYLYKDGIIAREIALEKLDITEEKLDFLMKQYEELEEKNS